MKRLVLGLVLVALSALAIPGSASAAASYTTFVGCDDTAENPQPSHECLTTDHMAAYFEGSEETAYEVCLFQGVEELECSSSTVAEANTLYENKMTIGEAGDYEVVWFVAGTDIPLGEEWKLKMASPPLPPPPPPPALPIAPVLLPALPTVSPACLAAQKRVKKLRAKIRTARGLQKAKLRGQLKKARAAVKASC